jgi:hypothetical protein
MFVLGRLCKIVFGTDRVVPDIDMLAPLMDFFYFLTFFKVKF